MTDRRVVYSTEQVIEKKRTKRGKVAMPSSGQGVRIRRETKRRGGKVVCVITGLPLSDAKLRALAKRLRTALGTGGSVKNGHIEIQGDHRPRLMGLLEKEGFRPKCSGG